jgi:hypothetical protein
LAAHGAHCFSSYQRFGSADAMLSSALGTDVPPHWFITWSVAARRLGRLRSSCSHRLEAAPLHPGEIDESA